ncbi:MAG: ribosomal-processing cysteine protease Prp [Lachnospiraceae bacterium]|nr:ribosomal-processing cysteine protease Prp [Lachnospiraceae bacterium]
MIQIRITENGIRMDGHAGCRRNGQDLVCAAISALTCSLLHSIQDLAGDRIRAETGDGFTQIEWEKLSEAGKLLVDSWFLAVDDINHQYHCIQYVTLMRPEKGLFSLSKT